MIMMMMRIVTQLSACTGTFKLRFAALQTVCDCLRAQLHK